MSDRAPSQTWERSLDEEDNRPVSRRIRSSVRLKLERWRSATSAFKDAWLRLAFLAACGVLFSICGTAQDYSRSFWWLVGGALLLLGHLFLVHRLLKMVPDREWGDWGFARSWLCVCLIQVVMMGFGVLINEHISHSHVTPYMLLGYCFYALFVAHACRFPVQFGATSALLGSTAIIAWAPRENHKRDWVQAAIITVCLVLISICRHVLAGDPPAVNAGEREE